MRIGREGSPKQLERLVGLSFASIIALGGAACGGESGIVHCEITEGDSDSDQALVDLGLRRVACDTDLPVYPVVFEGETLPVEVDGGRDCIIAGFGFMTDSKG